MGTEKRTQSWIIVLIVFLIAVIVPLWKMAQNEPPVKQGIDLVGGVDLLLLAKIPPEFEGNKQDMVTGAIDIVRNRLDPEGVREIIIQQMGEDRIIVQIPGEDDPERVKRMIGTTAVLQFIDAGNKALSPGTKIRIVDSSGKPVETEEVEKPAPEEEEAISIMPDKVLFKAEDFVGFRPYFETVPPGASDSSLSTAMNDIALEFNQEAAVKLAANTATMKGHFLALIIDDTIRSVVEVTDPLTKSHIVFPGLGAEPGFNSDELNNSLDRVKIADIGKESVAVGRKVSVFDPTTGQEPPEEKEKVEYFDITPNKIILTGDDLASANVSFGQMNQPIIAFSFKKDAAKKFGRHTAQHVKQYLAIALDNEVISCPVIREAILGGSGIIEGNFTLQEAQELVIKLNAGRLPVPLEIIENRTVGPTLGEKSIQDSKNAAILGAILILLFMILYYRLPGLMANIALIYYAIVFYGALSVLNATLTLPGIAGFVMSIGMAVDANVIIFERLKEELKTGKTFRSSVDAAFKRAFTAIFDSNITTIMAGIVLYYLGTGAIRGFAVTLVLGVITSMFAALTFTRLLMDWLLSFKGVQKYHLFGIAKGDVSGITVGGEAS